MNLINKYIFNLIDRYIQKKEEERAKAEYYFRRLEAERVKKETGAPCVYYGHVQDCNEKTDADFFCTPVPMTLEQLWKVSDVIRKNHPDRTVLAIID